MATERLSSSGTPVLRRNAVWPWVVMPLIVLALFTVLHNVRLSRDGSDQDSSLGSGIP